MRRISPAALITLLLLSLTTVTGVATAAPSVAVPTFRAGTATVDATWHVGAAAGQYSGVRAPQDELAVRSIRTPTTSPRPARTASTPA
ncbi:MAG: hypothetical protein WEB03_03730 [Nitriliruptor sp.]|uniref:hypothetical protein n=1 Tax=Nitriliruptor sp. TaxID=2448056 RepID=UPI00349FFA51